MASTKAKRSVHKKQLVPRNKNRKSFAPGQLVLNQRTLPGRQFVEFPLARGKTTEKVELFITGNYHSLTIDFHDKTSLNLQIEPSFTINARFQQHEKGDIHVLAEWPPIKTSTDAT
jgi:hypothetical protein